jgi:hypothetical protein
MAASVTSVTRTLALFAVLLGLGCGCAPKNEAMPVIVVAPGLKQRLMLMDRYKRGNDGRPRIPHVTVEEVADSDIQEDAQEAETHEEAEPPR